MQAVDAPFLSEIQANRPIQGGGSTFAIIVSVTVRAYPSISFTEYLFQFNTTANSDTYWNLTTLFHSFIPSLSEAGVMGYYYATPRSESEADPSKRGKLQGVLFLPEKTPAEAEKILAPLVTAVNSSNWDDRIYSEKGAIPYPAFSQQLAVQAASGDAGEDGRLSSRLLDHDALTSDPVKLKEALRKSTPPPWLINGHLVAGPGVRNAVPAGGSNAVLPAWRRAYTHVVLSRSWPPLNATLEKKLTDELREVEVRALKDLAPDMGAYVNEADPSEPEWQKVFWGENYARLKELKEKWDPKGVFWCRPCVGNEDWTVEGGDAIGQHEGKICRK